MKAGHCRSACFSTLPVAIFGAFAVLWLRRVLTGVFLPPYLVPDRGRCLLAKSGWSCWSAWRAAKRHPDRRVRQGWASEIAGVRCAAALEGARLRLRPILMTSFAFILGCVPLWTASGAGSVARQIMGTTVIGGMVAASAIRNLLRARRLLHGGEMVRPRLEEAGDSSVRQRRQKCQRRD